MIESTSLRFCLYADDPSFSYCLNSRSTSLWSFLSSTMASGMRTSASVILYVVAAVMARAATSHTAGGRIRSVERDDDLHVVVVSLQRGREVGQRYAAGDEPLEPLL